MVPVTTYPKALEAIRIISSLKKAPFIKHQKEIIYILFSMGFTVNYGKLKDHMLDLQQSSMVAFRYITAASDNKDNASELAKSIVDMNPKLPAKPGRPSTKSRIDVGNQYLNEIRTNTAIINVIRDITYSRNLSNELINDVLISIDDNAVKELPPYDYSTDFIYFDSWMQTVRFAEDIDFIESQEIINIIYNLCKVIDISEIPLLGSFIKLALPNKNLSEDPSTIRLLLFLLLAKDYRQKLQDILSIPEVMIFLSTVLYDKGGDIHG